MLHEVPSHAPIPPVPEVPRPLTIQDLLTRQDIILSRLNLMTAGRTSVDFELTTGSRVSKNGEGYYWVKKPGIFFSIGPFEDDYFGIKAKSSISIEYGQGEEVRRDTFIFNERLEGGKSKRNGHAEEPDPMKQEDINRVHQALLGIEESLG